MGEAMPGLLSDVLPYLYSQGDRAKRYMSGLLADPIGTLQQTAGGIVDAGRAQQGLLGQAFADPQRPFQVTDRAALAQAANNVMAGPLSFAPVGITVWHGSPHTFDRFDSSKIGTGEGNQAYGHGLYLAENPQVAQNYRKALSTYHTTLNGEALTPAHPQFSAAMSIAANGYEKALADAQAAAQAGFLNPQAAARQIADIQALKGANIKQAQQGNVYKVDLPDEAAAKMLDWDKPVNAQPAGQQFGLSVQKNPEAWGNEQWLLSANVNGKPKDINAFRTKRDAMAALDTTTGGDLYSSLFTPMGVQASQALRGMGIPGVRYRDAMSRSADAGTSNFVVFPGEESLLQILERNGVPLK